MTVASPLAAYQQAIAEQGFAADAAPTALNAQGVATFIIGFGESVDTLAMTSMALIAGTAHLDCNVNAELPSDDNLCYEQVNSGGDLAEVLDRLIVEVAGTEICDGRDNDCNGQIDEDLVRACLLYTSPSPRD